ncbi:MAG: BLUF domain-containing protein [Pseudomonadales bacterium]
MFHVIYVSTATEPISPPQLYDLLTVARQRNYNLRLTGLLLYAHERFMQVLEGPEPAVREVFGSIQRDGRHKNIDTLRLEAKEGRDFPDWRMGFRGSVHKSVSILYSIEKRIEPWAKTEHLISMKPSSNCRAVNRSRARMAY